MSIFYTFFNLRNLSYIIPVNTPRNNRGYSNASTNSGPLFNYLQNYHFNVSLPTQKKTRDALHASSRSGPGHKLGEA